MKKVTVLFIALLFSFSSFSQKILDTAFFPVYDSMGVVTYIKKSDVKEFKAPNKYTKIKRYNEQLNLIGYWVGAKMKFEKLQQSRKLKRDF
ncbi:MAG: hypothetical protein ABI359_02385 [Ginsengibacter sp.]